MNVYWHNDEKPSTICLLVFISVSNRYYNLGWTCPMLIKMTIPTALYGEASFVWKMWITLTLKFISWIGVFVFVHTVRNDYLCCQYLSYIHSYTWPCGSLVFTGCMCKRKCGWDIGSLPKLEENYCSRRFCALHCELTILTLLLNLWLWWNA